MIITQTKIHSNHDEASQDLREPPQTRLYPDFYSVGRLLLCPYPVGKASQALTLPPSVYGVNHSTLLEILTDAQTVIKITSILYRTNLFF